MIWPPPNAELRGSTVFLEPIQEAHHEPLRDAGNDPEIWAWMDRRVPVEPGSFDRWFETRLAARQAGEECAYVTHRAADSTAIGSSSYLHVRPEHDGLEIGWTWVTPSAWRSGANVEAKLLMLAQAFDELGCMRVEFKTDARNERSRGALEALPAKLEGIFRKHMLVPGVGIRDSAYFAITDEDWPGVRANLEARLAALTEAGAHA